MSFKEYTVTPAAVQQARAAGLAGNTAARLQRMARRSARITCPYGNRRFNDYVMQIEGQEVIGVTRVEIQAA